MAIILQDERLYDTRGRRLTGVGPISTGKRIYRNPAHLTWIEAIHRLGPQTSEGLHQLTKHVLKHPRYARYVMRDLCHEKDSEYGGPLLYYPIQQERGAWRPDRNLNVYDITNHAKLELHRVGLWRENTPVTSNKEWKHDFFGPSVAMSFYLGTLTDPDTWEFMFEDQIVTDYLHGQRTFPVPTYKYKLKDGTEKERSDAVYRPDGFFGIRYKPSNEIRIFIREEDCDTETNQSDDLTRKSHEHAILQQIVLFGFGASRKKYFKDARVVVLNTFSNPTKMRNVMAIAVDASGGKGINWMLYSAWTAFGDRFRPPAPASELFGEWHRPGVPPIDVRVV